MRIKERKLKKADALRKRSNAMQREAEKTSESWCRTRPGTIEYEKARHAANRAEAKADKAYAHYYHYVHCHFNKDKIDASFHKVCQDRNNSKKFTSKAFLDGLK